MRRLLCWLLGHRWEAWQQHIIGIPMNQPYYLCERCGRRRDA